MATLLSFGVTGAVGAWLWAVTTQTPIYVVQRGGVSVDAVGYAAAFNADAGFLLVAAVLSFAAGAVLAVVFRHGGVVTVLSVFLGSLLGLWGMHALGTALGPAPVVEQAADAEPGDSLSAPLEVQASGVFFAWPIGALAGAFLVLWLLTPRPKRPSAWES